jgi:hypothetical protein
VIRVVQFDGAGWLRVRVVERTEGQTLDAIRQTFGLCEVVEDQVEGDVHMLGGIDEGLGVEDEESLGTIERPLHESRQKVGG